MPGHVEVTVDWRVYHDVTLALNFMAHLSQADGSTITTETARVRLRDLTRSVTLGDEVTVGGTDEAPYQVGGIVPPAGIGRSKVRLEHRRVDADVATWGGEIDVDLG